jgi:hypothetical protein
MFVRLKINYTLSTFCQQYLSKQLKIPASISTLALYLAYLYNKGYAGSTISSYNSAVGYYHKLENVADPSTSFFISKLIQRERASLYLFFSPGI